MLERSDKLALAIRKVEKYFHFESSILRLTDRIDGDDVEDLIMEEYVVLKEKLASKAREKARLGAIAAKKKS